VVLVLPKERRWSGQDRRKKDVRVAFERRRETRRSNDELVREIIERLREEKEKTNASPVASLSPRTAHAAPAKVTVIGRKEPTRRKGGS
jgi:hypothetical protein